MEQAEAMRQSVEAEENKRRKRGPAEYLLQLRSEEEPVTYSELDTDSFPDAASAKRYVRQTQITGTFRIIRVVDEFTAEKVQTTRIKMS